MDIGGVPGDGHRRHHGNRPQPQSVLGRITDNCWKLVRSPVAILILLTGSLAFLILFRLAGLLGLVEYDAVMAWMLKAKIIHPYTGSEIVHWFSNPRLTEAHLDYPTLVPSLHAATLDSFGHVDATWRAWRFTGTSTGRVGRRQAGCDRDRSDIPCHLADADIEGEVGMLALGEAHGVVHRSGQVGLAGHQRDAVGGSGAETLDRRRLLRESRRRHGHQAVADGQRNAQPAVERSPKRVA